MSLEARLKRAVALSGPKALSRTAGVATEGYWLDDRRFFFVAERYDPNTDRVVGIPSMIDAFEQRIECVMELDRLRELIANHAGVSVEQVELDGAHFDMPEATILGVSNAGSRDYLIDISQHRIVMARDAMRSPALFSQNGRYACLVSGYDLSVLDLEERTEQRLTTDGVPNYSYGQESESCLSALSYRAAPVPMALWSPDSQWLLTHRIDERTVPDLPLVQSVPRGGDRPVLHRYKYPFPGDPMPTAIFIAIHVPTGRTVTFDDFPVPVLGYSPFSAFYRTAWFGSNDVAWVLRIDRYSQQGELIRLDLARGLARTVLMERVETGYFEFHQSMVGGPNVRTLDRSAEVIWFSERDGWGHVYLYDAQTGRLKNRITRGDWVVRDIVQVDEAQRSMLFTASGLDPGADPVRRSLCRVNLDGTDFKVLVAHDGDIAVPLTPASGPPQNRPFARAAVNPGVSPDGMRAVVHFCSVERGDSIRVVDLNDGGAVELASVSLAQTRTAPHTFSTTAADGTTRIHGVMVFPSDFGSARKYPLIDYIYPGPHIPHQPQRFGSVRLAFARALSELGFIVIMLDTRGVPFQSRAQHQIGYGNVLEPQLSDHAAAVVELCRRHPFIERDRIGMIGHSAGGAATARALLDYGSVFKVGVSVCGSHDSSMVTTMWSDKYRGPGDSNTWRSQANSAAAFQLAGKLLLICGDMDDNVHISQTLKLVDAFIRANRDFDMLVVPNEGHDLLMTNGYVQRRAWQYFLQHLRGEELLTNFEIRFEPHELARFENCYWLDFWP